MKIKLNKSTVEALETPESGQDIIWDSALAGFGIRISQKNRSYIAQGRVNGKSRRVTLGKHGVITADEARKKAKKELAKMSDGTDPQEEKKREKALSVTLMEVANDYVRDRKKDLKQSSLDGIYKHVNKSFSDWKDKSISSITRDKAADRHIKLTKKSPAQANQAFRVLRALINYAMARYRPDDTPIILENPVTILTQRKLWNKIAPREDRIPENQIGTAWNFLQELRSDPAQTFSSRTNADFIVFLLLTGVRWNEAAKLTWDRVDLKNGWFHLPDPKNRNPVTIPISAELKNILSERPKVNEYVFPSRSMKSKTNHIGEPRGTFKKLAKEVGLDRLSNHDLRRTFTNIALKECRIDLWKTKLLTNHKLTADVTIEHYSDKQDLRYLAQETEQITSWIVEQGCIAAAGNVVPIDEARRA